MTRHIAGSWNMMSDDRTHSLLRYGKGPRRLINVTVQPNAIKIWALSPHTCYHIPKGIREMNLVPARDVDEKPSQRGNEAAQIQMTVGNS